MEEGSKSKPARSDAEAGEVRVQPRRALRQRVVQRVRQGAAAEGAGGQEEAQRLGRILRPKEKAALFYTVVTADTKEQQFAVKRQLFLTEQGYRYQIEERAAK
jgi:hypothetical protein